MVDNATLVARLDEYQKALRDNFLAFLTEIWRVQGLPKPSRVQLDIAKWLQTGPRKRGILGFRGMSKTWITAAYICWRLYRDKNEKILLVSAAEDASKKTLLQVRGWLSIMPFLRHLEPGHFADSDLLQRDNTEMFDVDGCRMDRIASVTAMGVTGALPGGRATLIIPDDVEQKENTITRQQRERLKERVTELECILCPDGDIVYLGTYHHEESLYDSLQKADPERQFTPYRFRNWPIQYPTPELTTSILAPMLSKDLQSGNARPGDPVWPERFSREFVLSLVMGRSIFNQQFMGFQDMGDSNRFPLKLADLIVHPVNPFRAPMAIQWGLVTSRGPTACEAIPSPGFGDDQYHAPCMVSDEWLPYSGCKAFLDPAGSGEDEFAWCVGGQLNGTIYAKDLQGVHGGPTEANLDKLVASLKTNHCHELYVEKNFGGEGLIRLIEMTIAKYSIHADDKDPEYPNGWSCAVIGVHSTGQKEIRIIDALEPVMQHHRIVLDPAIAAQHEVNSLGYQLVHMTKERDCQEHDDRVEALAGMVSQFTYALSTSPEQANIKRAEEAREARLREFYRQFGEKEPAKTWSGLN